MRLPHGNDVFRHVCGCAEPGRCLKQISVRGRPVEQPNATPNFLPDVSLCLLLCHKQRGARAAGKLRYFTHRDFSIGLHVKQSSNQSGLK